MRPPYVAPSFRELVDLELDPLAEPTVRHRRSGSIEKAASDGASLTWLEHPHEDLIGLALSGGGIRSATFNLGFLQGLGEVGLIDALDYVSTVSGGGYIGGFWSAWRARRERAQANSPPAPPPPPQTEPFTEPPRSGRSESDGVRHLREFSNFLNPRLGLLTYDTGRLIASVFSSTLPALTAAVAMLILVVGAWLLMVYLILGLPAVSASGTWESVLVVIGLTAAALAFEEWKWVERGERVSWWYAPSAIVGLVALGTIWLGPALHLHEHLQETLLRIGSPSNYALFLLLPTLAWIATAVVLVMIRLLLARAGVPVLRAARTALDRVTVRLLALAGGWMALTALWIGAALLIGARSGDPGARLTGVAGLTAGLGALFGLVQRLLSRTGSGRVAGRLTKILKPKLPQLFAYAAVIALMLTIVMGILWYHLTPMLPAESWFRPLMIGGLTIDPALFPYVFAGAVTIVTCAVFNPNEVGLHAFYRARLARAYLGASNSSGRRQTEERRSDDIRLDHLSRHRPMHLICCAANDLSPSSDHLGNLHRGATSAVLSPVGFSVGSEWAAWPPDDSHVPTLASAMTASGAAFNSHMGSKSMELGPAVTFLMAALNLRLGLWLPHPSKFAHRRYRLFPGIWFYEEMLGQSRANGAHVHLSDGGHFENMALYELVRRHCRYIIASDCGADPDVAFDDLGNVVRRVREDFGVEIDIDLGPLKPDERGRARQSMVAGDIRYPNGDFGVLLVVKPTLTGDEPADIAQYRRRNEFFPHETTGDQFYDEAQWESYRRLGVHCARIAFRSVVAQTGEPAENGVTDGGGERAAARHRRRWAARVFAGARMRWQPIPRGLESRLAHIVDRVTELDALLQQPECGPVLREVYKEIDEIDRLAKRRGAGTAAVPDSAPSVPRPEDLAPSLHAIRRAILFMEEIYVSEDLERRITHPFYLGIANYFARWAYAPLFRMWWPLLKSLYAHDFTRFLERRFQMASVGSMPDDSERVVTALTHENEGFAMHCWRLHGLPLPDESNGERMLSFSLGMRYGGEVPYHVQAAQVLVRRIGSDVMWDADHFFVPPGLWGVGIGSRFLAELCIRGRGAAGDVLDGAERLLVRVTGPTNASRSMLKESADLAQLYRNADFRELRSKRANDRTVVIFEEGGRTTTLDIARAPDRQREWWFARTF